MPGGAEDKAGDLTLSILALLVGRLVVSLLTV